MSKHSPGPWQVHDTTSWSLEDGHCIYVDDAQDIQVAKLITGGGLSDTEANVTLIEADARLIAAAPDLLEACEQALDIILSTVADSHEVCIAALRAVIAKARGIK